MRTLFFTLFLLPLTSIAQEKCEPTSPEMKTYLEQVNWIRTELQSSSGSISGYLTANQQFYISDLSRSGDFRGVLNVHKNNLDLERFYSSCTKDSRRAKYLQLLRKQNRNNRYTLEIEYLPKISGFANDPFKSQNLKVTHLDFDLKWNEDSLVLKEDYLSEDTLAQVKSHIATQLSAQNQLGVLRIDLTNLDDVACDFALGKVQLSLRATLFSKAPLIEQEQLISPQDVNAIMENLHHEISPNWKENFKFMMAGKIIEKLETERRISLLEDDLLIKIVEATFERKSPECVSHQLQKYKAQPLVHRLNMDILVDLTPREER